MIDDERPCVRVADDCGSVECLLVIGAPSDVRGRSSTGDAPPIIGDDGLGNADVGIRGTGHDGSMTGTCPLGVVRRCSFPRRGKLRSEELFGLFARVCGCT